MLSAGIGENDTADVRRDDELHECRISFEQDPSGGALLGQMTAAAKGAGQRGSRSLCPGPKARFRRAEGGARPRRPGGLSR